MDTVRIFGTPEAPKHTDPELVGIDLGWDDISLLLSQHHALHGAGAMGLTDAHPISLALNGTPCRLTGTVLGEWHLVETVNEQLGAPKGFYLLPGNETLLENQGGKVPYFVFIDGGFDIRYGECATDEMRVSIYVLSVLERAIQYVTAEAALARISNSSDD